MKRRGGIISRKPSPSPPKQTITAITRGGKTSQRRMAMCSSQRSLNDVKVATASIPSCAKPQSIDILFDTNGEAVIDREGNLRFQRIISWYYVEKYQFAATGTHRSIIRTAVYDEIKSTGMKFFKMNSSASDDACILMDDTEAIRKIKEAFSAEKISISSLPGRPRIRDSFNSSSSSGLRWSTRGL